MQRQQLPHCLNLHGRGHIHTYEVGSSLRPAQLCYMGQKVTARQKEAP